MFAERKPQQTIIYSDTPLLIDSFIVVEHTGCGVFICKVIEDVTTSIGTNKIMCDIKQLDYRFVQSIDLSGYLKEVENAKRKEELKVQMEKRFAEIDKEKKYQYYADLDPEFKAMYDEFKNL